MSVTRHGEVLERDREAPVGLVKQGDGALGRSVDVVERTLLTGVATVGEGVCSISAEASGDALCSAIADGATESEFVAPAPLDEQAASASESATPSAVTVRRIGRTAS